MLQEVQNEADVRMRQGRSHKGRRTHKRRQSSGGQCRSLQDDEPMRRVIEQKTKAEQQARAQAPNQRMNRLDDAVSGVGTEGEWTWVNVL